MSDDTPKPADQAAPEEPKTKRGLFGRERKKMTMKEQLRELRPLFIVLILGGIGYAGYFGYTYFHVSGFTLEDQFHEERTVEFSGEKPFVVLVGDLGALSQATSWGLKLFGSYGDRIENVRIADLSESDPGIHGVIQGQIAKNVPVPVLLDYEGSAAKSFRYTPGSATVVVVGNGGWIKARVSGEASDENWAVISEAVDSMLES